MEQSVRLYLKALRAFFLFVFFFKISQILNLQFRDRLLILNVWREGQSDKFSERDQQETLFVVYYTFKRTNRTGDLAFHLLNIHLKKMDKCYNGSAGICLLSRPFFCRFVFFFNSTAALTVDCSVLFPPRSSERAARPARGVVCLLMQSVGSGRTVGVGCVSRLLGPMGGASRVVAAVG